MSLATRCTQCGTVFRVVQDQLKVSEGWVRCGRCDEVFSALEGLFDLGRDSPPPTPVSAAEALVSNRDDWRPSGNGSLSAPSLPVPLNRSLPASRQNESLPYNHQNGQTHPTRPSQFGHHSGFDSPMFEPLDGPHSAPAPLSSRYGPISAPAPLSSRHGPISAPAPLAKAAAVSAPVPLADTSRAMGFADQASGPETIIGEPLAGIDYSEARLTSELLVDPTSQTAYSPGSPEAEALAITQQSRPAPGFVRRAENAARWQSPVMKATLTMLALLLVVGLALQLIHHNRDLLAASYPAAEPWLERWCEAVGCTVEAPRNIADVHIESSALTPAATPTGAPDTDSAVKLSVVLRNHGALKVALPSLEVTLTDGAGRTLSRKALSPADFGVKDPVLATGAESTLQVVLTTGERKAAGYTVDVFYP